MREAVLIVRKDLLLVSRVLESKLSLLRCKFEVANGISFLDCLMRRGEGVRICKERGECVIMPEKNLMILFEVLRNF
jgi:hypothetical protein